MNQLLLLCLIGGRRAALPALRVQSVIEIGDITPVPGTIPAVRGLAALRSQALTVIDCTLALGLDGISHRPDARAAVVEVDGHFYALMVDEAYDVGEAQSDPVAVPGGFGEGWQRAAAGMVETSSGPALLMDIDALVACTCSVDV